MLTFIIGVIACIMFPPLILGIIGYAIGGVVGGLIAMILIPALFA